MMIDLTGSLSIFDRIMKSGKYFYHLYRENSAFYLKGSLTSGREVAHRIIALFEAHDVKRTQIYQLLGEKFPEITPALDAETLKNHLSGDLIKTVSELFAVRKAWVEGEDSSIYDSLVHYKDFPSFVNFVSKLKTQNSKNYSTLIAYKSNKTSDDLYVDCPQIELVFADPIGEIGTKTIFRYFPVYGPFPWTHSTARYYLSAIFNVADNTPELLVKGYSVPPNHIGDIGVGNVIPCMLKIKSTWYPEDFGYPESYTIGRLSSEDWEGVLQYFENSAEFKALKTNFC